MRHCAVEVLANPAALCSMNFSVVNPGVIRYSVQGAEILTLFAYSAGCSIFPENFEDHRGEWSTGSGVPQIEVLMFSTVWVQASFMAYRPFRSPRDFLPLAGAFV